MDPLKVCLLSAEIVPYAKTGGLADVAGALLQELNLRGHDARAFMPLYSTLRGHHEIQPVLGLQNIVMAIGEFQYTYAVHTASYPGTRIAVYFIDCPALYDRQALYTFDADEHRRFVLFTRASIESCQRLGFIPDVFHCNDWHTAMLPLYMKSLYSTVPAFAHARSVLTIHNIGYQGVMPAAVLPDLNLGPAAARLDAEDLAAGVINPLKSGIKFADVVTTVSPSYAREIRDSALGMGMQSTLASRATGVVGILNGVDYREWDPQRDAHLTEHFSVDDLRGKVANKQQLLTALGLGVDPSWPLISMVTRLAEQKGIDLLLDALPRLLEEREFGFVILGSGDERYQTALADLERRYASRLVFRMGHDESLAHLIEAGSDIFLMPSRYEPCGLNQMYSLRYGTIPIVRNTGGLADSVQHFDAATQTGTGCVFNDYDATGLQWGVRQTLEWFGNGPLWARLIQNAMQQDFSWGRQAGRYEEVYRGALAAPPVSSST